MQSFGDNSYAYEVDDDDDLITVVEFNQTGEYIAIGDKAGRISIVRVGISSCFVVVTSQNAQPRRDSMEPYVHS